MIAVLACIMGFIYYMSAQPVVQSGEMSFGVDRWICRHFVDGFDNMTPDEQETMVSSLDFWVRKSAHFAEYMVLGVILFLVIKRNRLRLVMQAAAAVAAGTLYAVMDEIHQYFVPGRACQLRDMLIDACGVTAGVLIAACALCITRKWHSRNKNSRKSHTGNN